MKIKAALEGKVKITPNKTFPAAPPTVELEHSAQVCEDCYDIVVDRHVDYRKTQKNGWQIKCRNCSMYKNPVTGEFDMTGVEFRKYWLENKKTK